MPSQREEVVAVGGAGCAAGARAPASKLIEDGMMPSHLLDRLVRSSTGRRWSAIGRTEDRSTTVRETVSRSFRSPIAAFGACQQVGGARQGWVGRRGRASTGGAARAWAVRAPPVWSLGAHLGSDAVATCARPDSRATVARQPEGDAPTVVPTARAAAGDSRGVSSGCRRATVGASARADGGDSRADGSTPKGSARRHVGSPNRTSGPPNLACHRAHPFPRPRDARRRPSR